LLAGGGVAGGRVVGASDAQGGHPHERPCTPGDLAATIHHAAGITTEVAAGIGLASPGKVLEELFS
jgi:hypothetical protein